MAGNLDSEFMPVEVKKNISKTIVKEFARNGIAPFKKLTGDNWVDYYLDLVWGDIETLNTPKKNQINGLFKVHLGIDEITSNYRENSLDDFVSLRGQIAHRMKAGEYLKLDKLKEHIIINHLVYDTDYYLYNYLKGITGKTPWNNTY